MVAPFTGAWIEMTNKSNKTLDTMSLPSRGRGLKLDHQEEHCEENMSLPSRGRGLKSEDINEDIVLEGRSLHGGVD